MASSNPFRKSVLQPKPADSTLPPLDPIDTTQSHAAPPRTSFRGPEPSDPNDEPEPEPERERERKQKPVKRVRVLTPPPLSPDSPEWTEAQPMYRTGAGLVPPTVDYDPFGGSATDESDRDSTVTPPYQRPVVDGFPAAPPASVGLPGNPFSRTLQDIEDSSNKEELELQQREEGEVLKAANAGTPALNVDAFKRLLLTGNSGVQGSQAAAVDQGLASINAEANKIMAAPDGAREDSLTDSDKGSVQQGQRVVSPSASNKDKKLVPPPPPSSRHGKTIRGEQSKPTQPEFEHQHVPFEANPTSHIPSGDDEPSDEDSSTDSSPPEAATPSSAKKPAPVPPPRRGHARTDTRSNLPPSKPIDDEQESRSSIDSTHRQDAGGSAKPRAQIPVPPPPRRPHVAPRQNNSAGPSPSVSSSSIPQRSQAESSAVSPNPTSKLGKSPAPPRPPARNPSSARRPHGAGGGALERRDSVPRPPPPPPRHRGSSSPSRNTSADRSDLDPSKGVDILADLDALRREVEALRGAR